MEAWRWPPVVVTALVAALFAGCSTSTSPMMGYGHRGERSAGTFGGSMMGSAPHGYHLSRLTCSAPSSLPGRRVNVMLGDMGMTRVSGRTASLGAHMMLRAVPALLRPGRVSFVVANMGWRRHEMVVLPLAPHQASGLRSSGPTGRVNETGSLGEASASCAAGSGNGIKPGAIGWMTLNLPAGRYELVCNLRNHYANGMHQLLVVT